MALKFITAEEAGFYVFEKGKHFLREGLFSTHR